MPEPGCAASAGFSARWWGAYVREGLMTGNLTRTTILNWLDFQDPAIADDWKRVFGFVPVPL